MPRALVSNLVKGMARSTLSLSVFPLLSAALPGASVDSLVPWTWNGEEYACKCYLGDDCWPSESVWGELNSTVDGNLLVNVPPGAVCHDVRVAWT